MDLELLRCHFSCFVFWAWSLQRVLSVDDDMMDSMIIVVDSLDRTD